MKVFFFFGYGFGIPDTIAKSDYDMTAEYDPEDEKRTPSNLLDPTKTPGII